jgi:hypothetical protein
MPTITSDQRAKLRPYLLGERANDKGEIYMYCPLHADRNRSASIEVNKGQFYCHKCERGLSVEALCDVYEEWKPPPRSAAVKNGAAAPRGEVSEFDAESIETWRDTLQEQTPPNDPQLSYMEDERGIWARTLTRYSIGWDPGRRAFTIPVSDREGKWLTVRFYQPFPKPGRRKIWGIKGKNQPRLYPAQTLASEPETIIICEGEWDAIICNQFGFPAVTRTSSAKTWKDHWTPLFKGKKVYVCHDMDEAGQEANERVASALAGTAAEVYVMKLPYPVEEDHGADFTDLFRDHPRDGKTVLRNCMADAKRYGGEDEPEEPEEELPAVPVDEIIQTDNFERMLKTEVTIRGVQDENWWAPRELKFTCTRDAGDKCDECPMKKRGRRIEEISPTDRRVLRVVGREESGVLKMFHQDFAREYVPDGKCSKLRLPEVVKRQPLSKMIAQQLVDTGLDRYHPDNNLKITAAGDFAHFPTNVQAKLTGLPTSDPNSNRFEFLVESMEEVAISTDHFEPEPETIEALRAFAPEEGQEPLDKLLAIATDLEAVTGIHGRPMLTAAMDLVWHSVLSFDFRRQRLQRGWLELLAVGDTRTGKSETALRLAEHYDAGAFVSCESATMAGIKGAVTKMGKGDDKWYISWGALPLNDRRLVILDEVKGLSIEEIADLSDVRSSGVINIAKARSEKALARTRAVWLSNPRDGDSVSSYYGIDCITPLIGSSEDVARFDFAIVVRDNIPLSEINRLIDGRPRYESALCNSLIRWVWSRKPEQVIWERGAEAFVVKCANKLVNTYVEDPPLVRRGDERIKVARLAVALAARLFSSDETGERLIVRKEHVRDAAKFLDSLFRAEEVGYAEKSERVQERAEKARANKSEARKFLDRQSKLLGDQLLDHLRGRNEFWNRDLQEFLGMDAETAAHFTSQMARYGMLTRGPRGSNQATEAFKELLKEVN